MAQLSGTYTIGGIAPAPDYATITDATDALVNDGVAGPVVFNIRSGVYAEQLYLSGSITGASASNTITFQSESGDSTDVSINGSGSEALYLDYVSFISFKNLSFYANNYNVANFYDSDHITLESVSISGSPNNTYYGLYFSYDCADIVIEKCVFYHLDDSGIYLSGGNNNTGWSITECSFSDIGSSGIYLSELAAPIIEDNYFDLNEDYATSIYCYECNQASIRNNQLDLDYEGGYGIYVYDGEEGLIQGNTINATGDYTDAIYLDYAPNTTISDNILNLQANGLDGIYVSADFPMIEKNTLTYANGFSGGQGIYLYAYTPATVQGNRIIGLTDGYGIYISDLQGQNNQRGLIANNFVQTGGNSSYYGIYLNSYSYTDVLHNSILNSSTDNYAAALYAYSSGNNSRIANNILAASGGAYAIYLDGDASGLSLCDYNDLYTTGSNLANLDYSDYTDLANWQSGTNFGDHSVAVDPVFVSTTDLHVSQIILNAAGLPGLGISTDIDGEMRTASPDIGADEFSVIGLDAGISLINPTLPLPPNAQDIIISLNNTASQDLTSAIIEWSVNGMAQPTYNWSGLIQENGSEAIIIGNYTFMAGNSYDLLISITDINSGATQLTLANDIIHVENAMPAMAGYYTIGGTTPDFNSFEEAITALYTLGVADDVFFQVRDGNYEEQLYFSGSINGVDADSPVAFQSESGNAAAVNIHYSGSVIYLEDCGFLQFSNLSFSSSEQYSYVVESYSAEYLNFSGCQLVAYNQSPYSNCDFSNHKNGLHIENCSFQYGYRGIYFSPNNTSSDVVLIANNFNDTEGGIDLYSNLEAPIINDNVIHSTGDHNSLYISGSQGDLQIIGNRIFHESDQNTTALYLDYAQANGGTAIVANNFISLTGNGLLKGLRAYEPQGLLIAHNSVRVGSTNPNATAVEIEYGSGCTIVNNIWANHGGGYAVIDHYGNHTYDYNDLFTTGSSLADRNYNPISDLSNWQNTTGQDANAISIDPFFVSATDLHAQAAGLDGAALSATGITEDIDGETRDASTPDIGADEFEPNNVDVALTALTGPLSPVALTNQPVKIAVYNFGLQTITSLDIEWAVDLMPQTTYSWTGSLAIGDSLHFTVGTYDFSSGGIFDLHFSAVTPNGGSDENPANNELDAQVKTALIGTYTIGSSGADFSTITEATEALQSRGAGGAVIFEILPGTYDEQVTMGDFPGNGTYAITFRSQSLDANSVLWQYAPDFSQNFVLLLDGVSNFTFEHLHFKSLGFSYAGLIRLVDAPNITFQNNLLESTFAASSSSYKIILQVTSICNNLQILNNSFMQGGYGIYYEMPFGQTSDLVIVQDNNFDNQQTALRISGADLCTITDNTFGVSHTNNFLAITVFNGQTALIAQNTITGNGYGYGITISSLTGKVDILKNIITQAGSGISFSNLSSTNRSLIANNFIQVGHLNANAFGIQGNNSLVDIYHNSILNISTLQSINSAALSLYSSGNYQIKNNILASTGGALVLNLSTAGTYDMDYNNLHGDGDIWAIWSNNFRYNLAEWQAASALDANSISVLPQFNSNTDLHLQQAALNAAGTPLAEVTDDIDGEARDMSTPDLGADEFLLISDDILPLALISPVDACANGNATVQVTIQNQGASEATGFPLMLWLDGSLIATENVGALSVPVSGTANYTFTATLDLSLAGNHEIKVVTQLAGDSDSSNDELIVTVESYALPQVTISSNTPVCIGNTISLSANGGTGYSWEGPNGFNSGSQNPSITEASLAAGGIYTVTVSNENSCETIAQTTVVVNATPTASASSNSPVCVGTTISLSANGGSDYSWEGPAGFSSNNPNPDIADADMMHAGTYTVTVTNENGCQDITSVEVVVNAVNGSIGSNAPICVGETLQLTADGGTAYNWEGPDGFSSSLQNAVLENATTLASGTYQVTITGANTCLEVLSVEVTVNALPIPMISPDATTICGGTPTMLTASGGNTYLWSTGATTAVITVSPTETTSYTVTATSAAGCSQQTTATITVNNVAPYFAFTGNEGYTTSTVEPQTGSPYQTFYFEIDYFDADGDLPGASFPRLLLDYNNNGTYNEEDDQIFVMTATDVSDTDVTDGKRYFYQVTGLNTSQNYHTAFLAQDGSGCASQPFTPVDEPNVVDFADIYIYANDITFSNDNPDPGTPLDVSATIHNDSDFDALDFVVRLVNQYNAQIYPDITVPNLPAHSNTTVSWTITTPAEVSWNPMQVFIDFTNVIDEPNELNNQAIRPFVNGEYNLPGTIAIDAAATPQESEAGSSYITISGDAIYDGTAVPLSDPSVAGATVTFTLLETGQSFSTYTNSEGHFARSFQPPLTPGLYHVNGSITDFTLTGTFTATFVIQPGPCKPDLNCVFQLSDHSVLVGESATGSITVTNNGCAPSTISSLLDVSGQNAAPIPSDALIPALNPGESYTYNFANSIQFNNVGTATLSAVADANFVIVESSEQNNGCATSVAVNPLLPDITIGYIASGGQKYQCNEQGFTIRLNNIGGVGTGAFQVERHIVRLSDDVVEYSDIVPINNIAPGNYVYSSLSHQFLQTGNYRIDVFADIPTAPDNGVVAELNENNNTGSLGVSLIPCLPDLRMDGVLTVTPVDAHNAGMITVTARTSNIGTAAVNDDVVLAFTIGANTVYQTHSGGINPGAFAEVSATLPSPGTACVDIRITTDAPNTITEVSEANNSQINQLTYDLYPGNYCSYTAQKFWQKRQIVNSPVAFQVGVFNDGYFTASSVKVKFEISGPGITGWLDWGFGTVNPVGKTGYCPYTVNAPTEYVFTQIGTYSVRMTVDPDNVYSECNEADNVMTVNVTVGEDLPDLRILSQYLAPSKLNPDVGEAITMDITYENIGESNIGENFKLSWEVNEVEQDVVDAIGLNEDDINTLSMPSSWSSNIPGIHIIRAKIDALDEVAENDELNNEATRAILVGQYPNLFFDNLAVSDDTPEVGAIIDVQFDVFNEGDLSCQADVQIFYVNDFSDTILLQSLPVTIPANDFESFTRSISVYDAATTLVLRILNADPEEFNTTDNEATIQLGALSVSALQIEEESCVGTADGMAEVIINGGASPYIVQWSNNTTGNTLAATAGTYQVSVTDNAGNTATAAVNITTATDMEQPLIYNGPGDINVTITDGNCPATVNWMAPEVSDNCGLDQMTSNYQPGDAFGPGVTTVTYTALDLAGNSRTYSFDIIVNAIPTALAGDDQLVCGNQTTLAATIPAFGTGQWTVVSGSGTFGDNSAPTTTISGLAPGLNVLQWEVTNGSCGSDIDEVELVSNGSGIIYVDQSATAGNNDGTSWENAFTNLQTALALAENCGSAASIWIAAGIYRPTVGADRTQSFDIPAQTSLYGGFQGGENELSARRPADHQSILSGDINVPGTITDNSYHVVHVSQDNVILDGLHITGGKAEGVQGAGGGLLFAPVSGSATLTVSNCRFFNNNALNGGAIGMMTDGTTGVLNLVNVVIAGNYASLQGGGIAASANNGGMATLDIIQASFGGNNATAAGGNNGNALYLESANATIRNSILWDGGNEILTAVSGGVTLTDAIVQGGATGTNIQDADPRYADVAGYDLSLQSCSPALDMGSLAGIPATDIELNARTFNSLPDLGAYEYNGTNYAPAIPSIANAELIANTEFTDADGWTHYYACSLDGSSDRLIFSIQKEGQDLGTLGADLMVRNLTTANYGSSNAYDLSAADYVETESWFVIGRYWDVDTPNEPANPVKVRYYYSSQDTLDLKASIEANGGLWTGDTSMYFFKVSGDGIDPFDEVVLGAGGSYHEYNHGETASLDTWTKGVFNGLMYAEYFVSSFSGGGGGGSPGPEGISGALPLDLLSFDGKRIDNQLVQLEWLTANEVDIDNYEIQRSTNGRHWEKVGFVASYGNSVETQRYTFPDDNAFSVKSYYRLRIAGFDGTIEYSPVIVVNGAKQNEAMQLYPNPTTGSFYLELQADDLKNQELGVQVIDISGQSVFHQNYLSTDNHWNEELNILKQLPAGIYSVLVWRNGEIWQMGRVVRSER
ncbi:MAG: hypothetical protein DHS20C18_01890 [Saprospiraceae bacterium]|nr:MAG: hypothetical protein DHS20C18_01890 [Saprospiraceae bacterium]